jgi:hypothetical protein
MKELFRILRPGGWALLQSPIDPRRAETFEDPAIVSPRDRERAFGQHNHVRIYGRDYKERLRNAGFAVKVDGYARGLKAPVLTKYGLSDEDIYFCKKPLVRTRGRSSLLIQPG